MPFCTYCGSNFSRDEHLERHILTHTNVKPFKCFTCHMSFARRDLLQRHYVVHGKDANEDSLMGPNGSLAKTGGRTPIACHNCAKTKTKCDKKFPCTRCAQRNLTCTVRPTRRATKNSAIAQRLEEQSRLNTRDGSSSSGSQQTSGPSSASSSPDSGPAGETDQSHSSTDTQDTSNAGYFPTQPTPHVPAAQMTQMNFENPPDQNNFFDLSYGPDGFAMPMPSPFSSEDQAMLDWHQTPFNFGYNTHHASEQNLSLQSSHPSAASMQSYGHFPGEGDGMALDLAQFNPPIPPNRPSPDFQCDTSVPTNAASLDDIRKQDLAVIDVLAAAHDAWSMFRCNPCVPSRDCPKTARLNLETLEHTLKSEEIWTSYDAQWQKVDIPGLEDMDVEPLQESNRDRLMAIVQRILHKALDTHQDDVRGADPANSAGFILLPPVRVLELFLRTYTRSFEQYYSVTPGSCLNTNNIMRCNDKRAASLLILLMIAQGASATPGDGQSLTAGLIEACRISLFDVVEKNIMMASDHTTLHAALLFTVQANWSGDKWQMDIAQGQRGMYINMLRHSGRLQPQTPVGASTEPVPIDTLWSQWSEQESRSRLIYAWVMADQETSLFSDTVPMFAVTELAEPLPSSDDLWRAKDAQQWVQIFEPTYERPSCSASLTSRNRAMSLKGLFRLFLDDGVVSKRIELTALHLRLLLLPLQCSVHQARELLSCFPDKTAVRRGSKNITAASTRVQLKDASTLLQRWYTLSERYLRTKPVCPVMQANLVIFHIISLNTITCFPEIERLARRDEGEMTDEHLPTLHKRCIMDVEEATIHCGQILRIVRSMSPCVRPPWWAGAVYRVALTLWTITLNHGEAVRDGQQQRDSWGPNFPVDVHPPSYPVIAGYLADKKGMPHLTQPNGSPLFLDNPLNLLSHCTEVIATGTATQFTDGLRLKLSRLAQDGNR